MKTIIVSTTVAALLVTGSALATDMPELAKRMGCTACHMVEKKLVGPAWRDIAKAYNSVGATGTDTNPTYPASKKAGDILAEHQAKTADEWLIQKVSKGGKGNWDTMPMPATTAADSRQTEIKELVGYILNLEPRVAIQVSERSAQPERKVDSPKVNVAPVAVESAAVIITNINDCEEIRDPATQTQVDRCPAHAGCKMVFGMQKTCVKIKTFLTNLKNLTSEKNTLDSNDVFDAAAPSAEGDDSFNSLSFKSNYDKQPKKKLVSGKSEDGSEWVYEGGMINNLRSGAGVLISDSGTIFRGTFVKGKQTGSGEMFDDKSRKAGRMSNMQMDGMGVERFADGRRYVGAYEADKFNGQGTQTFSSGSRCEAEYIDGKLNGQGTCKYADGNQYTGGWVAGKRQGRGTYKYASGDQYTGDLVDEKFQGHGTYKWINGNQYTGDWFAGKQQGRGTQVLINGIRFEGEFQNGKPSTGRETKTNGAHNDFVNGVYVETAVDRVTNSYSQRISAAQQECKSSYDSCDSTCTVNSVVDVLSVWANKGAGAGDASAKTQQCSNNCDSTKRGCNQQVSSLERQKLQAVAEAKSEEQRQASMEAQQMAGGNSTGASKSNSGASNSNKSSSNSGSPASNSGWASSRECDGQCSHLIADFKCKNIKGAQENLSCVVQNGYMNGDTPEICAQAKSLTGCMTKSEKLASDQKLAEAKEKYKGKGKYGSVCERNYEKINNVMIENNIKQYGATYDLFLKDVQWYMAKLVEPCVGSSAEAARNYKDSMDEYNKISRHCAGPHDKLHCTQWGVGGMTDMNKAWYSLWKAEVNKALSDPNYSADLGTVTGTGAVNAADAACDASLKIIENQYAATKHNIPKDSVVVLAEANMWRVAASVEKIKAKCPQSKTYKETAASLRTTYKELKRVCDALATRTCAPRLPGKESAPNP